MTTMAWADVGERVREARLAAGVTQKHLADALGVDRTAVLKVESGDRRLSALEAAVVAEELRVPLTLLVSPRPLAITSQRQPLGDDAADVERMRARADLLLEAHSRDVRWLVEQGYLAPTDRPDPWKITDVASAVAAAGAVRKRLQLGNEPLPGLADVAESLGLFVLVVDEDVEGASLDEGQWGVAVVGGAVDPGRRRSTAAHELAHHLAGDAYSSDLPVSTATSEREALIDSFATALLLPAAVVQGALAASDTPQMRRSALVSTAATYRVSWRTALAAARPFLWSGEERRLRPTPTLGEFLAVVGRGVQPDLPPGETGARYTSAVMAAFEDGAVTGEGAVRLLHDRLSLDQLPSTEAPDLW
ncbi:XRE family transcriptional regulator [uncultured Pseudokineococcus sp.]|uniref:XRE family transcriptional regulator n=1 Tax=uncultured Pseudokineococcus sp. TaxID=1642928 RepID=UPI002630585F|nr:XRE family transcriptional regulator [uncultured Pseudokineococcus sp.]